MAGFSFFKAIPRDVGNRKALFLLTYLTVFKAITGQTDRMISVKAANTSYFLSFLRQDRVGLSDLQYDRLIDYMDDELAKHFGVSKRSLPALVDEAARSVDVTATHVGAKAGRPRKDEADGEASWKQEQAEGKRQRKRRARSGEGLAREPSQDGTDERE